MTLSEAKSQSQSVINTLRSLGVPDVEIRARLVKNMGYTEGFVQNQLNRLTRPQKEPTRTFYGQGKTLFKPGSFQALLFEMAGNDLFKPGVVRALFEELKAEGYSYNQINSSVSKMRDKVRGMQ